MQIITAGSKNRERWAVRCHRLTVNTDAWRTFMNNAASRAADNEASARHAAIVAGLRDAVNSLAVAASATITSARFQPANVTGYAGMSLEVDLPVLSVPVMHFVGDFEANDVTETVHLLGRQSTARIHVRTAVAGSLYTTPLSVAISTRIALQSLMTLAAKRTLAEAEQQQYDKLQNEYSSALQMAASYYALFPNDWLYASQEFMYTPYGAPLSYSSSTGITESLAAVLTAPPTPVGHEVNAVRASAMQAADALRAAIAPNAEWDDPAAAVTFGARWMRYDLTQRAVVTLNTVETQALVARPQLMVGVAHELVRDAYGNDTCSLRDYANTIYYIARGIYRILGMDDSAADDADLFVAASYTSFEDYAVAAGLCTEALADTTAVHIYRALFRHRWEVAFAEGVDQSTRAAISALAAQRIWAETLPVSGLTAAAAVNAEGDRRRLVVTLSANGSVTATLSLALPALVAVSNDAMSSLMAAFSLFLARQARCEWLEMASLSNGTALVREALLSSNTLSVAAPVIRLLRGRLAGVGIAVDEIATPFMKGVK